MEAVPELRRIEATNKEWRIGAGATLTAIEETVAPELPALKDMLRVFGSRQIRNRATMGGNLATASPIGDCAPVLLALNARLRCVSLEKNSDRLAERTLPIDEFFVAYRQTALRPGEVLQTILLPRETEAPGVIRSCRWYKVSRRREMDISTVSACFYLELDQEGVVREARLAYGGAAAIPLRAHKAERFLKGKPWTEQTLQGLSSLLSTEFTPISDVRGEATFRQGLITSLMEKFFHESRAMEKVNSGPQRLLHSPRPLRLAPPHESGRAHVTGEAVYTDDHPPSRKLLEVWPVCSPHAYAKIMSIDTAGAEDMPGIRAVLFCRRRSRS